MGKIAFPIQWSFLPCLRNNVGQGEVRYQTELIASLLYFQGIFSFVWISSILCSWVKQCRCNCMALCPLHHHHIRLLHVAWLKGHIIWSHDCKFWCSLLVVWQGTHFSGNKGYPWSRHVDDLVQVQCVAMQKNCFSEKALIPRLFKFTWECDQSSCSQEFIVHAIVSLLCLTMLKSYYAICCTNDFWTCSVIV